MSERIAERRGRAVASASTPGTKRPRAVAKSGPKPAAKSARPATATAPVAAPPIADKKPAFEKKIIALVYDFDGTLSPKPMQEYTFLPKIGEDPKAFWAESNAIAREHGADPLITYMHLMYKKAKARGVRIDREELVALGRDVELFPGVETWFDEISQYVALRAESQGVTLRH